MAVRSPGQWNFIKNAEEKKALVIEILIGLIAIYVVIGVLMAVLFYAKLMAHLSDTGVLSVLTGVIAFFHALLLVVTWPDYVGIDFE